MRYAVGGRQQGKSLIYDYEANFMKYADDFSKVWGIQVEEGEPATEYVQTNGLPLEDRCIECQDCHNTEDCSMCRLPGSKHFDNSCKDCTCGEEKVEMPKFKQYTAKFPLGPPGQFYNSVGRMVNIKDMNQRYKEQTRKWLMRTFDFTKFQWAEEKFNELS